LSDVVFKDGVAVRFTRWDPWGRVVVHKGPDTDTVQHAWWHADATRAIAGVSVAGRPKGTWREWDEAGRQIGEVAYVDGVPGPVVGSSPLLLHLQSGLNPGSTVVTDGVQLPRSTATALPSMAPLRVVVSVDAITVGGAAVVPLKDGRSSAEHRRGALLSALSAGPGRTGPRRSSSRPWNLWRSWRR